MYLFLKRIIDILLSIIALPFVLILVVVVGLAIKVEDFGPVFFKADRIGKNGTIFYMYKFRSMKVNAPDIRLEDGSTYNSEADPRVTRVGKYIRKTSLDEIPQIFNILKGQMSFIGPRPDYADWLENYTEEEKIILTVLPGISGYNQVINRNLATPEEKIENDIYYVKNLSLKLDLWIFFETIKMVLFRRNIYREVEMINEDVSIGHSKFQTAEVKKD